MKKFIATVKKPLNTCINVRRQKSTCASKEEKYQHHEGGKITFLYQFSHNRLGLSVSLQDDKSDRPIVLNFPKAKLPKKEEKLLGIVTNKLLLNDFKVIASGDYQILHHIKEHPNQSHTHLKFTLLQASNIESNDENNSEKELLTKLQIEEKGNFIIGKKQHEDKHFKTTNQIISCEELKEGLEILFIGV
ncbi:hypothetical protein ABK040_013401 [Willaertia magna]